MSNSTTPNAAPLIAIQQLIEVVAQLRSPDGGCPWDLAQTPESLTPYVIEEAYEVVDAIRSSDPKAIAEELGDLLLQVILQAQIASESNQFSLTEIANGITEKLIRRHPHVFGDSRGDNPAIAPLSVDEVHQNWEQIKAAEKGETLENTSLSSKLSRIARTMPPISATMKISKKAAAVGFEWENVEGVWDKFREEIAEFEYAIEHEDKARQESELGDIMFALINVARWYDLDPLIALQETNHRFVKRFSQVEAACDRPISDYTIEELEKLWQKAKALLAKQKMQGVGETE